MKRLILFFLLMTVAFFAVSCGEDQADTAIQYIEALNQRDLEAARDYVCPARQDDVTMGLTSVEDSSTSFEFINVSCLPRGENALCRFTVEQSTEANDVTGVERSRQVIFNFEDGKICGFEEEVVD